MYGYVCKNIEIHNAQSRQLVMKFAFYYGIWLLITLPPTTRCCKRVQSPHEFSPQLLSLFLQDILIHVNNYPTRCNNIQFIYICKLLYMFRVVSPPIIRSSYHCISHYWDSYCYLSWAWVTLTTGSSNGLSTVDTVTWAPDDRCRYHPKRVEQFADINKLYIVASCWIIVNTYYAMHGPLNIKVKIPMLYKYSIIVRSRHNSIFVSYIAYV